jgi:integrase
MQKHPGIEERRDSAGRMRYRVRVRRGGQELTATLPALEAALVWRAQALTAIDGTGVRPVPPRQEEAATPARAATVEDAARRLCRGILEGTARTRDGLPYKPSVARKYEEALRLLVIPEIGALPVANLTSGDCQRLVDEIAARRTPEHARKALTALRVAIRLSQRYGELDENPCAGVRVPVDPDGEQPARILTPEECGLIVAAADADDARLGRSFGGPLIALALGTGLRLGELLALVWGPGGVDLDAGIVRVRRSLDRVRAADGSYPVVSPKSRAARRDVPLAPEDVSRLRKHRLATRRPPDGAPVFAHSDGAHLSPVPAYRAFKRAARRARVREAEAQLRSAIASRNPARITEAEREMARAKTGPLPRFHDCRHAYATHALAAGLSAHAVAAVLGHADAGLVLRRYGHALPDEVAGAGAALSAWRTQRAS